MSTVEYGVQWTWADGATYTAASLTRSGAELEIEAASGKQFDPHAVQVMTRVCGEWEPANQPQETSE